MNTEYPGFRRFMGGAGLARGIRDPWTWDADGNPVWYPQTAGEAWLRSVPRRAAAFKMPGNAKKTRANQHGAWWAFPDGSSVYVGMFTPDKYTCEHPPLWRILVRRPGEDSAYLSGSLGNRD